MSSTPSGRTLRRSARLFAIRFVLVIASSGIASAHNCGSLSDCYYNVETAAAVLAAIVAGVVIGGIVLSLLAEAAGAAAVEMAGSALEAQLLGAGGILEGGGPWMAEATNVVEGGAVLQGSAGSCVSACGEMLSNGAMSEVQFLEQLGERSNAEALADALNKLDGPDVWKGGGIGPEDAVTAARQGPIGAVLQVPGIEGHMVTIEPGEAGTFLVRDPGVGASYEVTEDWIAKYVSHVVMR